jgi:hypothetical protein
MPGDIHVLSILQVLGILYLLAMLYLTFLYYKRNNYSGHSFAFWACVWSFGILLLVFPQSSSRITQTLNVPRVIDFYLILGLMFFSIITFLNYLAVKRNENRIEDLVRRLALDKPRRKR